MNGCQYTQKIFTVPVSTNCTQQKWDLAFMSRDEFMAKYKISQREYDELVKQ